MKKQLILGGTILLTSMALHMPSAMAAYTSEIESNDTFGTANNLDAFFSLGTNPVIEIDSAGTLATVSASVIGSSGDSTFDWYSFSVGAASSGDPLEVGRSVYFDTDFAEIFSDLDTEITLFDTDGTSILAYQDDAAFDGPGDLVGSTLNAFLEFSFSTAGTYFLKISEFDGFDDEGDTALDTTGSYHLHISSTVAPVPVPAAVWLLGSALVGLVSIRRRTT